MSLLVLLVILFLLLARGFLELFPIGLLSVVELNLFLELVDVVLCEV